MRCVDNKAEPEVVAIIPGGGERPKWLAMKFVAFFLLLLLIFLQDLFFFSQVCLQSVTPSPRNTTITKLFRKLFCF